MPTLAKSNILTSYLDAHHPVAPAPDGAGALNAMRQALRQSSCTPSSVDYINAHATSTPLGDAAESAAIKSLMVDEGGMTEQSVNVSSTKGAIGHLLGAAGAVEAIFTILAVKEVCFKDVPPLLITFLLWISICRSCYISLYISIFSLQWIPSKLFIRGVIAKF